MTNCAKAIHIQYGDVLLYSGTKPLNQTMSAYQDKLTLNLLWHMGLIIWHAVYSLHLRKNLLMIFYHI